MESAVDDTIGAAIRLARYVLMTALLLVAAYNTPSMVAWVDHTINEPLARVRGCCLHASPLVPPVPLDSDASLGAAVLCARGGADVFAGAPASTLLVHGHVWAWRDGATVPMDTPPVQSFPLGDGLGAALALGGSWLVVGAPTQPRAPGGEAMGAVHTWRLQSAQYLWQPLTPDADTGRFGLFGASVALLLDAQQQPAWLVVGAPGATPATSSGHTSHGAVSLYSLAGTSWLLQQSVWGTAPGMQRGVALASLRSDAVLVSAPGAQQVDVLQRVGLAWVVSGTISAPPSTNVGAGFGHALDLSGLWLVVGAQGGQRALWLYRRATVESLTFLLAQQLNAPDVPGFGEAGVALSGALLGVALPSLVRVFAAAPNMTGDPWSFAYDWPLGPDAAGPLRGCGDGVFALGSPNVAGGAGAVRMLQCGPCTTAPAPPKGLSDTTEIVLASLAATALVALGGYGVWYYLRWRRRRQEAMMMQMTDSWADVGTPSPRGWQESL